MEITAKSVQEATKAAAEKLGVLPDRLSVTVLEETKGLFGKSTVRVRAEISDSVAAPVETPVPIEEEKAPKRPARGGRGRTKPAAEPAPAAPAKAEPSKDVEPAVAEAAPAPVPAEEPSAEVVATEEDANRLAEVVREVLGTAKLNVTVLPTGMNGRYVNLQIDGKDVAYLVGKHGEVLNALQYLVNIIASRRFNNGVRVTLDGNDYRRRREEALTQLSESIAAQVKKRGEEAVLDALPAFERRIVHKALSNYEGISTYSEGEEPNRRVVIAPAD